ncbi:MAG: ribosome maturation factor RimP [Bacteroidota bacterium]
MEKQQIHNRIEEIVKAHGFILIDLIIRGDNHLRIIEVFIDGEKGINADDCSNVSRALNNMLETENLIETNYRLDVSSPGIERPLKFLVQFGKHINRKFEVTYKEGGEEKKLIAKLVGIEGEDLFFAEKDSQLKINFNNITKAIVLISF